MSAQPKNTTDAKVSKSADLTPEVTWAQRSSTSDKERNYISVVIHVPDVDQKKLKLDIQDSELSFEGYSTSKKANYAVKLAFFAEIDASEAKKHISSRAIELKLLKKELKEEYWPRLLKESGKVHFLKTDFEKWVDEDEQDEAVDDDDYMSRMGGMGGMGGDGGFGGIDFSKLGGAGAGGLDEGLDDEEEDDEDDEDDEMPDLEETKDGKGKAKIEEIA